MIECNIVIDPPAVRTPEGYRLPGGGPLFEGGGELGGYDPSDLQSAYGIPATGGSGETAAVVDAYGYAAAESDLAKYREKYGLAACTKASGCFKKVNQKGEEKNYPPESGELEKGWSVEAALDLDMVSAACPGCHIMLVEATTQEPKDTAASAEEAATLGATEISNSYGYPENNETYCPAKKGCKEYLASYSHAGIPVTVSAGDSGYNDGVGAPSWPATSPNVIAVGGTSLNKSSGSQRGWKESVWGGSGSGCSLYETKPTWQTDTACTKRLDNDVSAVASSSTPVSVYNTPSAGGWVNIGGTSVSAPLVAAIEAHATSAAKTAGAEAFYKHPGMLFDVTAGSNGSCTPPSEDAYLCKGRAGYDGPTGWGTPNGVPHTTGWFAREVPNIAAKVSAKSSLSGVSCVSLGECVAVGHTVNSAGTEVTLAEYWDGVEWKVMETPNPTGAKSSSLSSVACGFIFGPLLELCTAVGKYVNSSGVEVPLAEQMGAGGWSISGVPSPTGAKSSSLSGVTCLKAELGQKCTAVGHYVNSEGKELTLGERFSSTWSILETVNPAEAKASSLSSVACAPVSETTEGCIAVGHDVNAAGTEVTLGELWLAGKWVLQETPNPTGAKASSLSGLSCVSSTSCNAVGRYTNSGGTEVTLAEGWAGVKWAIQETPNPTGAKSSSLLGVACASGTVCTAVGHYVNSESKEVTLAEGLASGKWTVQETANPAGAKNSSLSSVSCSSTTVCESAGHEVNSESTEVTMAEGWASSKWAIQEVPRLPAPTGSLSSVSCSAAEACTAVGHYINGVGTEVTLAERWNGKEWSLQETPNPAGAKSSSLSSVSCASAGVCTAVGHYVNSESKEVTLAEGWASSKWTIQETVNPTGAKSSSLAGVWCASTTVCEAVGHYVNSESKEAMFAEGWASSKWTIQETPSPTGAKSSGLLGVSCASAEVCTAVGHYVNSESKEVTLAEGWASSKWTVQEAVNATGAKSSSLAGVWCASTTVCEAVGHYVNSESKEVTLAEGWASSKWTVQEAVNATGAKSSSLAGVSCTSTTVCTAVGHYVNSGSKEVTLAESWASSKWTVQETPNPIEAKSSSLAGVSCKTAEGCLAAGHFVIGTPEVALVEEHA